LRSRTS